MSSISSIVYLFAFILLDWSAARTKGLSTEGNHRQPRHLLKSKLCFKLGICGGGFNQGHGGYQGGYQGGHQGGYQGGYPPIHIGISQSQTSSSAGGGGYGSSSIPNNYQHNNRYPGHYNNGYHGQYNNQHSGHYHNGYLGQYNNGYPEYNRPGYFGNEFSPQHNQYYGARPSGGYGFQGPFGNFYNENGNQPGYEDEEVYSRSAKSKTKN